MLISSKKMGLLVDLTISLDQLFLRTTIQVLLDREFVIYGGTNIRVNCLSSTMLISNIS